MKYKVKFEKEFAKEILLGERFRLFIIATIFGVIILYLGILLIFFQDWFDQFFQEVWLP